MSNGIVLAPRDSRHSRRPLDVRRWRTPISESPEDARDGRDGGSTRGVSSVVVGLLELTGDQDRRRRGVVGPAAMAADSLLSRRGRSVHVENGRGGGPRRCR